MKFVLIVLVNIGWGNFTSSTEEFPSLEACQDYRAYHLKYPSVNRKNSQYSVCLSLEELGLSTE